MTPTNKEQSSKEEGLILVELTPDELRFVEQHRAIYGEVKAGVTYREKPPYLDTTIETPSKIIKIQYHPLTTKWQEGDKKRNPNKISLGKFFDGKNTLEFASYLNSDRTKFFAFLNGERISLCKDDWRKLFRTNNRIGHFLGLIGSKRRRKRRKKTP